MGMSISIVKHLGISDKTSEVKILVFSFLYFHPLPLSLFSYQYFMHMYVYYYLCFDSKAGSIKVIFVSLDII